MRKFLLFLFLLLAAPILAAGTIDLFPEGEKLHQDYLVQARNLLQKEAKGPLGTRVLRYRDVLNGEKRTFLWTIQKFEDPDGSTSYAIVFTQVLPGGKQDLMTSGGFSRAELVYSDELDPAYATVYDQLNHFIRETRLVEGL